MTEKMNPPILGVKRIKELEVLKNDLELRLSRAEDASPIWNECVWSYAVAFYELFNAHYSQFPDFADHASAAARHNATVSALDVIKRQCYDFNSLRPSYEKQIFDRLSEHIVRSARVGRFEEKFLQAQRGKLETSLTGKQLAAYASAGIDLTNPSPLLALAVEAAALPPAIPTTPTLSETRKVYVHPLLGEKGWSILDWANEASVAYHTVADYLDGKTKPYPSSRKKMAEALGITIQQLPK